MLSVILQSIVRHVRRGRRARSNYMLLSLSAPNAHLQYTDAAQQWHGQLMFIEWMADIPDQKLSLGIF